MAVGSPVEQWLYDALLAAAALVIVSYRRSRKWTHGRRRRLSDSWCLALAGLVLLFFAALYYYNV